MRHANSFRKFSRTTSHRRSMFRNLATQLIAWERIQTTLPKAKDLRRVVEKLITLGRTDTLHNRRQAYGYLKDKAVVQKLFSVIGPRFKSRNGGYTRVVRTKIRAGDAAQMAVIEFVERTEGGRAAAMPKKQAKKPGKKAATKAAKADAPTDKKNPAKKKAAKKAE